MLKQKNGDYKEICKETNWLIKAIALSAWYLVTSATSITSGGVGETPSLSRTNF